MSQTPFLAQPFLQSALSATGVHIEPSRIFDSLDWETSGRRIDGLPHSIFQIANHLIYWQDVFLSGLAETSMTGPAHASDSWPGEVEPASEQQWVQTVDRFRAGLEKAHEAVLAEDPLGSIPAHEATKRISVLNSIALHNSYHVGQVALIRQLLGSWPPPGGGHTW